MLCKFGKDCGSPEFAHCFRAYGIKFVVNGNTNAHLAFAHAKCSGKLYLVAYAVLLDEILELLNYLTRALDMT